MTDDAFQKLIAARGVTAEDMKDGVRQQLTVQKVLERDVSSKVAVTDQDIRAFFDAHRAQFNLAETSYHIAQIVVTPGRDPQITNGTGDDAATPQAAAAKVQMLMERLKAGASFRDLATAYSEDPESAPRGGDLGFLPVSRLKQAPPQLRDAVLNKAPGSVNIASAGGGYAVPCWWHWASRSGPSTHSRMTRARGAASFARAMLVPRGPPQTPAASSVVRSRSG
jgi:peptidyl-prolyl cis-trans isomerase SurA